jgi:hypothetical protein
MTKQVDRFEGLRIYVVVPGTVQTPIRIIMNGSDKRKVAGRFTNTRDIVQPPGRQAMQIGHVRGMVEHALIMDDFRKLTANDVALSFKKGRSKVLLNKTIPYHVITGIAKACRDSFELIHVRNMLDVAGIRYFEFRDTQEDLYEDVVTALATEPVSPFVVAGILDYLPLWTGK